jgi:hypothetical protein
MHYRNRYFAQEKHPGYVHMHSKKIQVRYGHCHCFEAFLLEDARCVAGALR